MAAVPTISYRTDILPLFRDRDITCMAGMDVWLDDYSYLGSPAGNSEYPSFANANHVLARLKGEGGRRMPPDGAWPSAQIEIFERWISENCPP